MLFSNVFIYFVSLIGKPRGLQTARKQRNHRRDQKWHDKHYKKAHLPSRWVKPFQGSSHAKGIVLEKVQVPNLFSFNCICILINPWVSSTWKLQVKPNYTRRNICFLVGYWFSWYVKVAFLNNKMQVLPIVNND